MMRSNFEDFFDWAEKNLKKREFRYLLDLYEKWLWGMNE